MPKGANVSAPDAPSPLPGQRAGHRFAHWLRLSGAADYRHVFQAATRSGGSGLVLLARANHNAHPRLGLAISRKCAARAVQRNRIKRLSREAFRRLQHELGGVDFIVLGRRGLADRSNKEIRALLDKHFLILASQCKSS